MTRRGFVGSLAAVVVAAVRRPTASDAWIARETARFTREQFPIGDTIRVTLPKRYAVAAAGTGLVPAMPECTVTAGVRAGAR